MGSDVSLQNEIEPPRANKRGKKQKPTMELHVRAVAARNLLDVQTFGTQDPFCKLKLCGNKQHTRVDDNGGACA